MDSELHRPDTVLDAVENIVVLEEQFFNEIGAIRRLMIGMDVLYHSVADQERRACSAIGYNSIGFGNLPGFAQAGVNREILTSMFDWYAINASRVFGLIGHLGRQVGQVGEVKEYQGRVCGPLLLYRHKIAAHYAAVEPKTTGQAKDNPADLALSVMEPISFAEGRFMTGRWGFAMGNENEHHQSQHNISFSVTVFQETCVLPRKILSAV